MVILYNIYLPLSFIYLETLQVPMYNYAKQNTFGVKKSARSIRNSIINRGATKSFDICIISVEAKKSLHQKYF